jgi:nucleotide-binding universal stress UspA family protein
METILVLTDFSSTSKNAALYAFSIAAQLKSKRIVLYNAYQAPPVLTEATVPVMPVVDLQTLKEISEESMDHFYESVKDECPAGIEVVQKTEFGVLSEDIQELTKTTEAELIVIGITGASKIEEVFIGSTATSVMRHSNVPVIIVPAEAKGNTIRTVMLATDYKKVMETTPINAITNFLKRCDAKLHVVNVYEGQDDIKGNKMYQQELLHSMLNELQPEFHSINSDDFIEGINSYVDEHSIDLIITIPRKHGFFDGLFKERHTKKLAFHSHVPLMFIQEKREH